MGCYFRMPSEAEKEFAAREVTLFRVTGVQKWAGIILSLLIAFAFPVAYLNFARTTPIDASLFYDNYSGEAFTALVLILIFTVLIWLVSFNLYRAMCGQLLAVGPGGISYKRDNRYLILAGWDDIVACGPAPDGLLRVEGFYVRVEAVYKGKAAKTGQKKTSRFEIDNLGSSRAFSVGGQIPLSIFSKDWENEKLGSLLRKYCPRLFENDGSGRALRGAIPEPALSEHSDRKPPGLSDLKRPSNPAITLLVVSVMVVGLLLVFFGYLVQSDREAVVQGQVTQTGIAYRTQRSATIAAAPETKLRNFGEGLPEVQRSIEGQIPFTAKTWAYSQQSVANLKTFYGHALVTNPFDSSQGSWEYGFLVTSSAGKSFLFSINETGSYSVYQAQGSENLAPTRIANGTLTLVNTNASDMNLVEIYATGDKISFAVNTTLVATEPQSPDATYEVKMAYYPPFPVPILPAGPLPTAISLSRVSRAKI